MTELFAIGNTSVHGRVNEHGLRPNQRLQRTRCAGRCNLGVSLLTFLRRLILNGSQYSVIMKRQMEHPLSNSYFSPDAKLPPSWKVEPLADGSLRVMQTDEAKRREVWWGTIFALGWDVALLVLIAAMFDLLPDAWEVSYSPWALVLLVPIAVIFTWGAVAQILTLGSEMWIVSHNRLEHKWGNKSRRYVNGRFELRQLEDEGHVYWQLDFKCPNGWTNQGSLWKSDWSPHCTAEQLRNLGTILSEKTGWPLILPPEMSNERSTS